MIDWLGVTAPPKSSEVYVREACERLKLARRSFMAREVSAIIDPTVVDSVSDGNRLTVDAEVNIARLSSSDGE